ncbi:hypothetical protein TREMEDRAFT_60281 [Tremella mesenterica DSM 1558]|uniref:uncharacterized protein n=1 Tax=Tremella mesenterica (strain ATCC 24925 / CBS 8224 / DSM 1558 / NBRC 9311 / NRRL Y-6157 / RJB 2259-6 / UBC 559-6) TaxID=578456 RepID=UPI0003F4A2F4|nr:uncharacterized protein TREMEDRAFT_60281 [Tremella mesenterica DSM 1558]EIW71351.1 hypothetical protein TREMEDRAFT_60281 [Tremella mesenterica DSM 1558]
MLASPPPSTTKADKTTPSPPTKSFGSPSPLQRGRRSSDSPRLRRLAPAPLRIPPTPPPSLSKLRHVRREPAPPLPPLTHLGSAPLRTGPKRTGSSLRPKIEVPGHVFTFKPLEDDIEKEIQSLQSSDNVANLEPNAFTTPETNKNPEEFPDDKVEVYDFQPLEVIPEFDVPSSPLEAKNTNLSLSTIGPKGADNSNTLSSSRAVDDSKQYPSSDRFDDDHQNSSLHPIDKMSPCPKPADSSLVTGESNCCPHAAGVTMEVEIDISTAHANLGDPLDMLSRSGDALLPPEEFMARHSIPRPVLVQFRDVFAFSEDGQPVDTVPPESQPTALTADLLSVRENFDGPSDVSRFGGTFGPVQMSESLRKRSHSKGSRASIDSKISDAGTEWTYSLSAYDRDELIHERMLSDDRPEVPRVPSQHLKESTLDTVSGGVSRTGRYEHAAKSAPLPPNEEDVPTFTGLSAPNRKHEPPLTAPLDKSFGIGLGLSHMRKRSSGIEKALATARSESLYPPSTASQTSSGQVTPSLYSIDPLDTSYSMSSSGSGSGGVPLARNLGSLRGRSITHSSSSSRSQVADSLPASPVSSIPSIPEGEQTWPLKFRFLRSWKPTHFQNLEELDKQRAILYQDPPPPTQQFKETGAWEFGQNPRKRDRWRVKASTVDDPPVLKKISSDNPTVADIMSKEGNLHGREQGIYVLRGTEKNGVEWQFVYMTARYADPETGEELKRERMFTPISLHISPNIIDCPPLTRKSAWAFGKSRRLDAIMLPPYRTGKPPPRSPCQLTEAVMHAADQAGQDAAIEDEVYFGTMMDKSKMPTDVPMSATSEAMQMASGWPRHGDSQSPHPTLKFAITSVDKEGSIFTIKNRGRSNTTSTWAGRDPSPSESSSVKEGGLKLITKKSLSSLKQMFSQKNTTDDSESESVPPLPTPSSTTSSTWHSSNGSVISTFSDPTSKGPRRARAMTRTDGSLHNSGSNSAKLPIRDPHPFATHMIPLPLPTAPLPNMSGMVPGGGSDQHHQQQQSHPSGISGVLRNIDPNRPASTLGHRELSKTSTKSTSSLRSLKTNMIIRPDSQPGPHSQSNSTLSQSHPPTQLPSQILSSERAHHARCASNRSITSRPPSSLGIGQPSSMTYEQTRFSSNISTTSSSTTSNSTSNSNSQISDHSRNSSNNSTGMTNNKNRLGLSRLRSSTRPNSTSSISSQPTTCIPTPPTSCTSIQFPNNLQQTNVDISQSHGSRKFCPNTPKTININETVRSPSPTSTVTPGQVLLTPTPIRLQGREFILAPSSIERALNSGMGERLEVPDQEELHAMVVTGGLTPAPRRPVYRRRPSTADPILQRSPKRGE